MILSTVTHQKHPGWGSLASVCRDWQHVLENANFNQLTLGIACLEDFEHIASPEKRKMIHHICLNIELPRYTSTCCSKKRSPTARIGSVVSNAIWNLFSILGTWTSATNLALELNVYSPSDCEHWFKNLHLPSDDVGYGDATRDTHHDLRHGWSHGQQVKAPPAAAIQRLFRTVHLVLLPNLPRVKAVTSLVIRRQMRRCITPAGVRRLLDKLDGIEHILYEPWAPYDPRHREFHDRGTNTRYSRQKQSGDGS